MVDGEPRKRVPNRVAAKLTRGKCLGAHSGHGGALGDDGDELELPGHVGGGGGGAPTGVGHGKWWCGGSGEIGLAQVDQQTCEGEANLLVRFAWPEAAQRRQQRAAELSGGGGKSREAKRLTVSSTYL
jgi:hypothetical protein